MRVKIKYIPAVIKKNDNIGVTNLVYPFATNIVITVIDIIFVTTPKICLMIKNLARF